MEERFKGSLDSSRENDPGQSLEELVEFLGGKDKVRRALQEAKVIKRRRKGLARVREGYLLLRGHPVIHTFEDD